MNLQDNCTHLQTSTCTLNEEVGTRTCVYQVMFFFGCLEQGSVLSIESKRGDYTLAHNRGQCMLVCCGNMTAI